MTRIIKVKNSNKQQRKQSIKLSQYNNKCKYNKTKYKTITV